MGSLSEKIKPTDLSLKTDAKAGPAMMVCLLCLCCQHASNMVLEPWS